MPSKIVPPTAEDRALAAQVAEWLLSLADSPELEKSDYLHNLYTYGKADVVTLKGLGIVASAPQAFNRELAKRQERPDFAKSQYVGTIGERLTLKVRLLSVYDSSGQFGATYIHKFITPEGNLLTWFGSSRLHHTTATSGAEKDGERVEPGHEILIKATIKRHGEYKGAKETTLSRADITVSAETLKAQKAAAAKAKREAKKAAAQAAKV